MSAPCVLIASCTDFHPKEIVKNILGVTTLPSGEPVTETIEAYPWHIDTKYYTANIHLCTTETRTIGDREFADSVQGLVLFFDTAEESSFQQVRSWLPFVKELEPQVQLLLCESCKESDRISRQHVLTWCLENAFELVELDPVDNCDIEDDDFQETTGIKRVIQALHAHPWPNLIMKDRPAFRSSLMTQMMADEVNNRRLDEQSTSSETTNAAESATDGQEDAEVTASDAASAGPSDEVEAVDAKSAKELRNLEEQRHNRTAGATAGAEGGTAGACAGEPTPVKASKAEKKQKNEQEKQKHNEAIDAMLDDDMAMFRVLGGEENEESFEELFERMRLMKERAEHLPPEERKKYAEKVAVAFWKAMGGDEDEIDGISGSDEDDEENGIRER